MKPRSFLLNIILLMIVVMPYRVDGFDDRYSFGVGVGSTAFNLDEANIVANYVSLNDSATFTDNSTTFVIYGGIRLDEYMVIETDFLMQGDIAATQSGVKRKLFDVDTLSVTVALQHELSSRINAFARIGVHMWDATVGSDSLTSVDSSVDLTYGLGLDINVYGGKERVMRIQWNHYEYDGVFLDHGDTLSLSLRFLFPG